MQINQQLERVFITSMSRVKNRGSKISTKHQITIPLEAMRSSGLTSGQRVVARADGPGRIVLEREDDVLNEFCGVFDDVYEPNELSMLRSEWA